MVSSSTGLRPEPTRHDHPLPRAASAQDGVDDRTADPPIAIGERLFRRVVEHQRTMRVEDGFGTQGTAMIKDVINAAMAVVAAAIAVAAGMRGSGWYEQ
jgi:hypothetical protein